MNPIRPRRGTKVWRRSAALTVLLALSVSFPLVAVAASIQLSPHEGTAGSAFTVTGSGFGPLVPVKILWDGTSIAKTTPTATGDIEASVTVPQGAEPGPHRVVARQAAFSNASATFTVEAPPTTTTSTNPTTTTTTSSTTTTTTATPTSTSAPTTTSTTTTATPTSTSAPTTTSTTMTATPTSTSAPTTSEPPNTSTTSTMSDSTTTTSPDRSTPPTTVSTTGPTSTTAGAEPELRMDPLNASDPFGPEVMAADVVAGNPDSAPPRLAGGTLRVTNISVSPISGVPGTTFELSLALDGAVPGLSTVSVLVNGEAIGEPIVVDGDHVDVLGVFPELAPGGYPLVVFDETTVLARSEVHILAEPVSSRTPALLVGLLSLTVAGVAWGAHWVTRPSRIQGSKRLG